MSFIGRFVFTALVCAGGLVGVAYWSGHEGRAPAPEAAAPVTAEEEVQSAESPAPAAEKPAAPPPEATGGHPGNAGLRINAAGLAIIKESEGLRLDAYEAGGRWYIGYGHNATARPGMTISEAEAEALLRSDVGGAESAVKKFVAVPVNANEFSAMVSLCYNLGSGNFGKSAVVARLNAGDRQGAADAFRDHNRGGGVVLEHLVERREKERTLFLAPA